MSYYCYYMKRVELKVARIGNSRGVRIPATPLERYSIGDSVVMEELTEGILLRSPTTDAHCKMAAIRWCRAMKARMRWRGNARSAWA